LELILITNRLQFTIEQHQCGIATKEIKEATGEQKKKNIQIVNILLRYPNIERSQLTMSTPTSQAKTKQVEDLLQNDCHLFEMQMHPVMVPFLTPMKSNANSLAAYIVPVNHNRINTVLVTSIASNMMNRYSQDDTKDVFQLQDMGTDAGMIVCYHEKHRRTCFSKIFVI
jgi:hypothetical protein